MAMRWITELASVDDRCGYELEGKADSVLAALFGIHCEVQENNRAFSKG